MDKLVASTTRVHGALEELLALARASVAGPDHPEEVPDVLAFLVAASRHYAAVSAVVVPPARTHLTDGHARARAFVEQTRRLELTLNQVRAKLQGSAYAVRRPWPSIWSDVERELEELWQIERALVEDLVAAHRDSDPNWGERLRRAEQRGPGGTEAWIPHQGLRGHLLRTASEALIPGRSTTAGRRDPGDT